MKIEIGKTYLTRDGDKVRIVYTDGEDERPIIGLINNTFFIELTKSGRHYNDGSESGLDLIKEHSFWEDVEVDTPIYVRNSDNDDWLHRHFAKYENDRIFTWDDGRTSFTSEKSRSTFWRYYKLKDIK